MEKLKILAFILIFFVLLFLTILFLKSKIYPFLLRKNLKNISIESIDVLNGYDFEIFVSALLKSFGLNAKTTQKSRDHGADILASYKNKKIAIQAKLYYKQKVGTHAVQEIFTAKEYYHMDIAILITNNTLSTQAIETSKKLNILIIDREILSKLLSKSGKQIFLLLLEQYN